jgi:outer membrane protein assembly factor BamB
MSRRTVLLSLALVATIAGSVALHRAANANIGTPAARAWTKCYGAASLGPASLYEIPEGSGTRIQFSVVGGNKLYALNAEGGGVPFWGAAPSTCLCSGVTCADATMGSCCHAFASPIDHVPTPVQLTTGEDVVFVPSEDGILYKINAMTGATMGSIDLKRPGCGADKLKAAATVELARFQPNGSQFRTVYADHDIVFVPTSFDTTGACATTAANRIYAVDAQTMTLAWSTTAPSQPAFNNPSVFGLAEAIEGCEIDDTPGTDTIYCAFRQPGTQYTLVAVKTHNFGAVPANAPVLKWQKNAGDVMVRPFLRGTSLYVATAAGLVKSYNALNGAPLWSTAMTCDAMFMTNTGCNIINNTWAEFRNGYGNTLLAVTRDGVLHSVTDTTCVVSGTTTPCGIESWTRGSENAGDSFVTEPAVDPFFSKIYAGKSDGRLHQFNFSTGMEDGYITINAGAPAMGDPALDSVSGTRIDRLSVGASTGDIARLCPPWPFGTATALQAPPRDIPGATPKPAPEPVPLITSCSSDAECNCYGCNSNAPPANCTALQCRQGGAGQGGPFVANDCNTFKCDWDAVAGVGTHTCYIVHANDGLPCAGAACTLNNRCVDGICHGETDPACGVTAQCTGPNGSFDVGRECATATVQGHCCPAAFVPAFCANTTSSVNTCGNCNTACQGVVPACSNGVCCETCGSGACVDTSSDRLHCGGCAATNRCTGNDPCIGGSCEPVYVNTGAGLPFADACLIAGHLGPYLANQDDAVQPSLLFPISLTFQFYGQNPPRTMWVSSNGVFSFDATTSTAFNNTCVPGTGVPSLAVFPFWDDLKTTVGVCTVLEGAAPNRRFLITWEHATLFADATADLNFTIAFYEGGRTDANPSNGIDLMYGTMTGTAGNTTLYGGGSATIGMEDASALNGTEFTCNSGNAVITSGRSLRFVPQ